MKLRRDQDSGLLVPVRERVWTPHRERLNQLIAGVGPSLWQANTSSPVRLLLHFEGSDGDTAINDSSSYAHSLTGTSTCKISTTRSKWGTSSLKITQYNGLGIATALSSDYFIPNGTPWCCDFWLYHEVTLNFTSSPVLFCIGANGGGQTFLANYSSSPRLVYNDQGFGAEEGSPAFYTTGVWTHVANGHDGVNTYKRFHDGVLSFTYTSAGTFTGSTAAVNIGGHPSGVAPSSDATVVYMDEFRLIIGENLYTTDFTPPSGPYS